jgi:hypothetical protein
VLPDQPTISCRWELPILTALRAFTSSFSLNQLSYFNHRGLVGLALIRVHFEHGFEDYDRQVKQKHGNILHAKPTRGAPCSFPK